MKFNSDSLPLRHRVAGAALLLACSLCGAQIGIPMPSAGPAVPKASSAGPSLQDTLKWIERSHDAAGAFLRFPPDSYMKSGMIFDGCDAMAYAHTKSGDVGELQLVHIPLHKIDPDSVTVSNRSTSSDLWLGSVGKEPVLILRSGPVPQVPKSPWTRPELVSRDTIGLLKSGRQPFTWKPYEIGGPFGGQYEHLIIASFPRSDEELAQRHANAIRHAIALCVEANRAERAKRPKELF